MSISKRIILVTGANKGIGLETARQLGKQGHTVLVGVREAARAEATAAQLRAEGVDAVPLAIDVADAASVKKAAAQVQERYGKLDSLINNAGIATEGWGVKTTATSVEGWRKIFEVNLFGLIDVTLAFLPLVQKSEAGRIVNLSSILGSLALHADPKSPIYHFKAPAYDASKTAVNQFTVHLAYELQGSTVKVNSAHPGWVKTDLGGDSAPMNAEDGAKTSVWLATLPADGPTGGFFHFQERLPW